MRNDENDEARMTNDERNMNARHSDFDIPSTFDIHHLMLFAAGDRGLYSLRHARV
jgi:hypothetical protein